MGLLDRFTRRKQPPMGRKGATLGWVGQVYDNTSTSYTLRDDPSFSDALRAYSTNATVRACVDTIANAAASVPFVAYTGQGTLKAATAMRTRGIKAALEVLRKEQIAYDNVEELDGTNPVIAMLLQPNPEQSREEWLSAYVGYQLLAGNAYIHSTIPVVKGRARQAELYYLNPDSVEVEGDGMMGGAKRYIYKPDTTHTVSYGSDSVLHIKASAWTDTGVSPLASCVDAINQNTQARKWNSQLLRNNAKPAAHANYVGEEGLDDESYDLLLSDLNNFFKPQNSGKVILTTNTELKEWGLTPEEMSWLSGIQESSREICRAFRVAPQILGDVTTQTYANYREARQSLYMDTVIPVVERLTAALTRWYKAYDPTFLLIPNVDEIEALSENVTDRFTRANATTFLSVDERRMMVGYEPIGGELGDKILVSSAMAPLDMVAAADLWMNSDTILPGTTRGTVNEEPQEEQEEQDKPDAAE